MKLVAETTYQCWMWEDRKLRGMIVIVVILVPPLVLLSYSSAGIYIGLIPIVSGFGFYVVYKTVGNKVKKLYDSVDIYNVEASDALLVNGVIESPGIAVLRKSEMELIPIVGKPVTFSFADVTEVKEGKTFNGSVMWGKKGFWLTIPGRARLGFAVSNTVADHWRDRIAPASHEKDAKV